MPDTPTVQPQSLKDIGIGQALLNGELAVNQITMWFDASWPTLVARVGPQGHGSVTAGTH